MHGEGGKRVPLSSFLISLLTSLFQNAYNSSLRRFVVAGSGMGYPRSGPHLSWFVKSASTFYYTFRTIKRNLKQPLHFAR